MNTQSAPESPATAQKWLSVAVAAARLGLSARAIQKRCASGKMAARRVAVPGGIRWEVDGRELSREPANEQDANPANFGREPANQTDEPRELHAQKGANRDANPRTDGREQDANTRELLEREREFSAFLKSQLEEANRNAAELRAALREALKIAPRQLNAGEPSANLQKVEQTAKNEGGAAITVIDAPNGETAINAPQRAQNGETGRNSQQPLNGARIEAERPSGTNDEEISADELRELCFRVARGP